MAKKTTETEEIKQKAEEGKVEKNTEKVTKDTERQKRHKRFLEALDEIDKQYKGDEDKLISILDNMQADVKRVSSGSIVLDSILGGGLPVGRIIEIYGPESSGKTSIALNAIANVQREGGNAVFIDAEQALDPHYASILGVNLKELGLSQSSIAETALGLCKKLADSGEVDLIVVDSVAALTPQQEMDAELEKAQVAILARVMSKALRVLIPTCKKNNCTIIFLNQIREKVGVMFGNPETTPGGKALKFYASQRIEVRRKEQEKDGKEVIGTKVRLKVAKNKVGAPFKEGLTVLTFAQGINRAAEMIVVGDELDIIEKNGNTYWFTPDKKVKLITDNVSEVDGRIKIGIGRASSVDNLAAEPELFAAVSEKIAARLEAERTGLAPEYEK